MTIRRAPRRLAGAMLVAVSLMVGLASPAYGTDQLDWGYGKPPRSHEVGNSCIAATTIWARELGLSGVTRLKVKFQLVKPTATFLPFETRGYYYSGYFPNDATSYWDYFPASFRFFIGPGFEIRAIIVGERPSLWQRDLKKKVDLRPLVGCDGAGGIYS